MITKMTTRRCNNEPKRLGNRSPELRNRSQNDTTTDTLLFTSTISLLINFPANKTSENLLAARSDGWLAKTLANKFSENLLARFPENSGRPAFQSSIKTVKRLVIDAQGVVETSQSTYIHSFLRSIDLRGSQGLVWPSMKSYFLSPKSRFLIKK